VAGTWFIQILCKVFEEHSHHKDLHELLTMVGEGLALEESEGGTKQSFSYETIHFKKLYFNPTMALEVAFNSGDTSLAISASRDGMDVALKSGDVSLAVSAGNDGNHDIAFNNGFPENVDVLINHDGFGVPGQPRDSDAENRSENESKGLEVMT
jgi:hypothetical protein